MMELESLKLIVQGGMAGVFGVGVIWFVKLMKEEREDRAKERDRWFEKLDGLTGAIGDMLESLKDASKTRCPFEEKDRSLRR